MAPDDASDDTRAPRPFRFGVQASKAGSGKEWVELARRVEGHGYSTLAVPDHFDDQFAPMPALATAAAATETLRVGALVFDNDYKHPLVLAKELATLDVLSEGRVEIGIGAGWMRSDYDQAGITYDPPGVRVERLVEGLAVLEGVLSGEPFSFEGTHYRIDGHTGRPLPVQRPRPPILIGAGGPRMLRIAGREADIVGINPMITSGSVDAAAMADMVPSRVDAKVAAVRDGAGDRIGEIELNVRAFIVRITDDRREVAESMAGFMGITPEDVLEMPFSCIGTPAQIADDLRANRERWGFSYVIVGAVDVDSFAPVVAELAGT
jgi:probable F420-dependent oxidoreductase